MNDNQRLQLNNMIKINDVVNVTDNIREKKHSGMIDKDIKNMIRLKKDFSQLAKSNSQQFDQMIESQCAFLFEHYTDIFNRLKKDELSLDIMDKFLDTLKKIEDGLIDQHEGAFFIGKYLKELYIDSALQRGDKLDKEFSKDDKKTQKILPKKITWSQYKQLNNIS